MIVYPLIILLEFGIYQQYLELILKNNELLLNMQGTLLHDQNHQMLDLKQNLYLMLHER